MHLDDAELLEHLQAMHRQMTALQEQLAALRQQQKALCDLLVQRQTLQAPIEQGLPATDHATPDQAQETLAECAKDILRVLREVGHPLTTLEILDQLVHRQLRWRESTVSHSLVELLDHGVVANVGETGVHRYGLTAAQ
jgi:hypothetical protein